LMVKICLSTGARWGGGAGGAEEKAGSTGKGHLYQYEVKEKPNSAGF